MARMTNVECRACGIRSERFCEADEQVFCICGQPAEQLWWERPNRQTAEWSQAEQVTVFRKPDGTYSYPARSDKPTPVGYERITIKSDAQMAKHEREAGVVHELRHFDSNGRGMDERMPQSYGDAIRSRR